MRTAVINADDFGLGTGVNAAVEEAHRHGVLRSASLMPNGAAFEAAATIARALPQMGVGIHVSLVGERALAAPDDIRGLVSVDGRLPRDHTAFARQWMLRGITPEAVLAEIEAQIARFLTSGLRPTHIDSHQHLHLLPGVLELFLDAAVRHRIPVIRVPRERGGEASPFRRAQRMVLRMLAGSARRKATRAGVRTVDAFHGFGVAGRMTSGRLADILNRLGEGVHEIHCHPALPDTEMERRYPWGYDWQTEHAALLDPAIAQLIKARHIRLAHFGEAWAGN